MKMIVRLGVVLAFELATLCAAQTPLGAVKGGSPEPAGGGDRSKEAAWNASVVRAVLAVSFPERFGDEASQIAARTLRDVQGREVVLPARPPMPPASATRSIPWGSAPFRSGGVPPVTIAAMEKWQSVHEAWEGPCGMAVSALGAIRPGTSAWERAVEELRPLFLQRLVAEQAARRFVAVELSGLKHPVLSSGQSANSSR